MMFRRTDFLRTQVFRERLSIVQFQRRHRRHRLLFAPLLAALALAGCSSDAPQDAFAPEGEVGRRLSDLAAPVFWIAGAIGVLVYLLLVICIVKFRRRDDDHVPVQVHGNTKLELFWGAVPAALLAVVGVFSVGEIFEQAKEPADAYQIAVIGHQWWWEYQYPMPGQTKLDLRLQTIDHPDDIEAAKEEGREPKKLANVVRAEGDVIVAANELHVPAGKTVRLLITSDDVMHNYWVPKLAGKIYAIPGKINRLTLKSDPEDAGKIIYGQCAEFCGTSHANMRFKVVVDSPEDFEAWLANQAAPALAATSELAKKGEELFNGGAACSNCHWTDSSKTNSYETFVNTEGEEEIVKKIGPNLAHIGSRQHIASAIGEMNERELKAWLRDPQEYKPGSKMVIRKLSEDEVNALVAYIMSLK
jgi:cytochrome c oxidase subunit II